MREGGLLLAFAAVRLPSSSVCELALMDPTLLRVKVRRAALMAGCVYLIAVAGYTDAG